MYPINNYIGNKIRRIVFLLENEEQRVHFLLGILEVFAPESDQAVLMNTAPFLYTFPEMVDGKKLHVAIDTEQLTAEMADKPWEINKVSDLGFEYDSDDYHWADKAGIISSSRNEKNDMMNIMPMSRSSLYYRISENKKLNYAVDTVMKNKNLRDQLTQLSETYLGYDVVKYQQNIGEWLQIWYNPVYKEIEMTENRHNAVVYIRVNFRPGMMQPLTYKVIGKDKEGNVLNKEEIKLSGQYLMCLSLSCKYDLMDIEVLDREGTTIDFFNDVAFIRKMMLNCNVIG